MERVRKYIDHMGLYVAALLKWIVVEIGRAHV